MAFSPSRSPNEPKKHLSAFKDDFSGIPGFNIQDAAALVQIQQLDDLSQRQIGQVALEAFDRLVVGGIHGFDFGRALQQALHFFPAARPGQPV